ncbi:hypothetical protein [Rossellomorea marisflavi]|uniref:hypothetical protein n=1 Tax=Rossellomorea marisflavi TaxID=189381 RepID=UPI003FA07EA0
MSYFDFKFELEEEVLLKESKKRGKVKMRKVEESHGLIIIRYMVDCGGYNKTWYEESQLLHSGDQFKVSNKVEIGPIKGQIDFHLSRKEFHLIPELSKRLQEVEGGESIV